MGMTFSIAGLCPRTGAYGCAMATSSMAAGARAVFVAPGAGVVLSQARSDPRLGEIGLARLHAGDDSRAAIAAMIAASPHAAWRQLAVLDLRGGKAANTGEHCTEAKGERFGDGVIAVGNGLANDAVVGAMIEGYAMAADRSLPDRLIAGLEAGLAAGGEAFPLRSAALKVARPGVPLLPIDLRVDLSETPIEELRRYWVMWEPMSEGYVQRCVDPANSQAASLIEGYA
jgi:uncharacterized Ntn-hydrolase superfamily protein